MPLLRKRPPGANPNRAGWKHAKEAPAGYRYASMTTALPDIVEDCLKGMSQSDLYEKYIFLCAKPFTLHSLEKLLCNHGATAGAQALKRLAWAKGNQKRDQARASISARKRGHQDRSAALPPEAVAEIAQAPLKAVNQAVNSLTTRLKKLGEKHLGRMETQIDKVHTVIEKKKVGPKTLGRHLAELDKFDVIARRTFQMDEGQELTKAQWQVGLLVNLNPEMLQPAIEVESTECPSLPSGEALDAS